MFAIAARTGSPLPELVAVTRPRLPAVGEVLCRTLELGVCGTDREILHSESPWCPVGEERLILGHECLARIEEVGAGVSSLRQGDLVVPTVRRAFPGQTRRADLLPFGPFTERGIFREHGFSQPLWLDRPEYLFRVPEEIADIAILTEPLAVSEKGTNEALLLTRARLGDEAWNAAAPPRVLVTGMGPIGFTAVLAAIARGWPVTMIGRDAADTFRAQLVTELGGQYLPLADVDFECGDVEETGYDLCLECTGSDEVMLEASRLVRSCGVIVWLGSTRVPRAKKLPVERLMRDGLTRNHLHIGCVNAAPRDFEDALNHMARLRRTLGRKLTSLITARTCPEDALWHYTHRQPQGIKTVVDYA
jgi:threonine dehydrogenase-like Zn-dependent dehydrogenase